jgi:hypothetical protein
VITLLFKVPREKRLKRDWSKPDQTNLIMLEKLEDVSPKAKNIKGHFLQQKAELMAFIKNRYAMSGDPFELPVCEHCERWCSWHDKPPGSAYCWYCGQVTVKPITVEEWFSRELKIQNIYDALRKQGIDYLGGTEPVIMGEEHQKPESKIIIASR